MDTPRHVAKRVQRADDRRYAPSRCWKELTQLAVPVCSGQVRAGFPRCRLPGEMKNVLHNFLSRVTSRISLVMLIVLPATGGTRRKSRILVGKGRGEAFISCLAGLLQLLVGPTQHASVPQSRWLCRTRVQSGALRSNQPGCHLATPKA